MTEPSFDQIDFGEGQRPGAEPAFFSEATEQDVEEVRPGWYEAEDGARVKVQDNYTRSDGQRCVMIGGAITSTLALLCAFRRSECQDD